MKPNETWNDTQRLLAFIIVTSFIVVIIIWLFHEPQGDAGANAVLNMLMGSLASLAGMVATFYFGSSKGSKDKDDTISSIATATHTENGSGASSTATVTAPTATAPGSATVTMAPTPPDTHPLDKKVA
jgi:hypothetical protein